MGANNPKQVNHNGDAKRKFIYAKKTHNPNSSKTITAITTNEI